MQISTCTCHIDLACTCTCTCKVSAYMNMNACMEMSYARADISMGQPGKRSPSGKRSSPGQSSAAGVNTAAAHAATDRAGGGASNSCASMSDEHSGFRRRRLSRTEMPFQGLTIARAGGSIFSKT